MLVLARRRNEAIHIGDDIVVTVLDVDASGVVRLGIEAPRKCRILRHELLLAIQEENRLALADPEAAGRLPVLPVQEPVVTTGTSDPG